MNFYLTSSEIVLFVCTYTRYILILYVKFGFVIYIYIIYIAKALNKMSNRWLNLVIKCLCLSCVCLSPCNANPCSLCKTFHIMSQCIWPWRHMWQSD